MLKKLLSRTAKVNSLLCVGLDSDVPGSQFEFNKKIIDETHEFVCAYKPNFAFYEARGPQGLIELKQTMEYLQNEHPDIFTIADAKRADIGSSNAGYVTEIFDYFNFDAVTLHPYLGQEALQPFLERKDKVNIILCHTSNPGAGEFQEKNVDGRPLWRLVAENVVNSWNSNNNCMLVAGATYLKELKSIREIVGDMPLLVPGVGRQGGKLHEVLENGLGAKKDRLIISVSRDILFAPDPRLTAKELRKEILPWLLKKSK